jgi:hypothetical protein
VWVARSYTQLGSAILPSITVPVVGTTYPNPPDNGVLVSPAFCIEASAAVRGRYPGLYYPWASSQANMNDGDKWTNVAGLTGVTLEYVAFSSPFVLIDRFGPWT